MSRGKVLVFGPVQGPFVSLSRCPLSAGLFRAYLPFLAGPDFYDTICLPDGQRFFMWPSLGFNKPPGTATQRCVVYGQRVLGIGVFQGFIPIWGIRFFCWPGAVNMLAN